MKVDVMVRWLGFLSVRRIAAKMNENTGAAIVETALMVPIFSAMLVGAVEFATVSYAAVEVSNAAAAGVQYGVQSASTSGDVTGIQNAAANEAPDITLGSTVVSHSCICSDGSASTCLSTDCSTSHIETILTVKTQATVNPRFRLPGLPTSYTVHGLAVQKVMQ